MRTKIVGLFTVVGLAVSSGAGAITFGQPDVNNEYPNVASVRGIVEAENVARISCSGSLIHRDAEKVVILTAASPCRSFQSPPTNRATHHLLIRTSEQFGH